MFRSYLPACALSGALALSAQAGDGRPERPSPLTPAAATAGLGVTLALDFAAVADLRTTSAVRLSDFPLSAAERVELELEQFDVLAPDAVLVLVDETGEHPLPRPDITLFGGRIAGEPDSRVFLAISDETVQGRIVRAGREYVISSGPHGAGLAPVIYELDEVTAQQLNLEEWGCASDLLGEPLVDARELPNLGLRAEPCRIADIAIETDQEYRLDFGSDGAAANYAAALLGAVSEIYVRDVNMRMRIVYLRLWNTTDPWTQNSTANQLFEFQDYWNANMTHIQRSVATYLSARGLGGGVAYGGAACYPEYDYSLNANLNGSFPYPIQNNSSQNWDLMVTAHELGHNFGAPHTHDMTPQVDNCAGGDCSVVPNGTIMSYCHLCSGGLANVRMELHPRTIDETIEPFLASGQCVYGSNVLIALHPESDSACVGQEVTFSVLAGGGGTLTYQWRRGTTDIPGATAASYTIPSVSSTDAGLYRCVVTNECSSSISTAGQLTVCSIAADANADCSTDLDDLLILLGNFGATGAGLSQGDFDGDTDVDLDDLLVVLGAFGESC